MGSMDFTDPDLRRVGRDVVLREVRAFNLRMTNSLRLRLDESARGNGRSLNAEIVQRLLRSFEGYRR